MRAAFITSLIDLAKENPNVYLLVADVGYRFVEPFAEQFPDRFANIGIAEQNMVGIAAGLALSGKKVFLYSIANFPTLRCLEQIRNDICYHKCDVKVVTSGSGLIYGALGVTHHVTEDVAVIRALPNMTVLAPGDPVEAGLATRAAGRLTGPCYLRLGRTGDPTVHTAVPQFEIGRAIPVRKGVDGTIIASGVILNNTVLAAQRLSESGINSRVISMPTIKPIDKDAILAAAEETGTIFTVEEHSVIGGLGSAVAEVVSDAGIGVRLVRLGIPDQFTTIVGSRDYLLKHYSLSPEGIAASVEKVIRNKKKS